MLLALEIGMFVYGIVALIKGRVTVGKTKVVTGAPAYVIGALLVCTVPLIFLIAIVDGFYLGMEAAAGHRPPPTALDFVWIDFAGVAIMGVACFAIASATAKPLSQLSKPLMRAQMVDDEDVIELPDDAPQARPIDLHGRPIAPQAKPVSGDA